MKVSDLYEQLGRVPYDADVVAVHSNDGTGWRTDLVIKTKRGERILIALEPPLDAERVLPSKY